MSMENCPKCGRKLLSRASDRCNWCGAQLEDAGYLAQAAEARTQFFAHQADADAQSLAHMRSITASYELNDAQYSTFGFGPCFPFLAVSNERESNWPQRPRRTRSKTRRPVTPAQEPEDLLSPRQEAVSPPPAEPPGSVEFVWQPGVTPSTTPLSPVPKETDDVSPWYAARPSGNRKNSRK